MGTRSSSPELDWSFADAPDGSGAPEPPSPPAPIRTRPSRRPVPWRRLAALAGLAGALGLSAWLFMHLGWLRLQSQLAAQIVYEDQRARAGDVGAVLALQAPGQSAWHDELAARVRLGLAAPLPAGDLLPSGSPPRLARLDPLGGDLFAATVARDYSDSAGRTVVFDVVQRYHNPSPGLWERLAPDVGALGATILFQGQRLSATVPAVDLPWFGPALLMADDLIVRSCADWEEACPPGLRLEASFGAAQELTDPTLTARVAPAAIAHLPEAAGYPRIFDQASAPAPGRLVGYMLLAPLLSGRPHDAAAQAALSRSISAQLLGDFAGEVSGLARGGDDYFLDALVARAEVRHLGAAAAPQTPAPQDYVPIKLLWQAASVPRAPGGWHTDLAARREAFDFLNWALRDRPPSVDGALLRSLRRGGGMPLDEWLARSLVNMPRAWEQHIQDALASHAVADWHAFDGLVLACDGGVYQVQAGQPKQVLRNLGPPGPTYGVGSLSPDRRYLDLYFYSTIAPAGGVTNSAPSTWTSLAALDLSNGDYPRVFEAPQVNTFGWSATGQLIYTVSDWGENQGASHPLPLWAYDPASQTSRRLIPDRIDPYTIGPDAWSADHSTLLLGLADGAPAGPIKTSLAVLTFGPPMQLRRLAPIGDAPALSPDGRRLAFVTGARSPGQADAAPAYATGLIQLNVLDRTTGAVNRLAAINDVGLPLGLANFWGPRWSPDGARLAWRAYPLNQGDYLLSAPAAGGPVHVWAGAARRSLFLVSFSPDERYLAARMSQDMPGLDQYWLFDQHADAVRPPITGWAHATLWTPNGHRLIVAGAAGVAALDPATGEYQWLGNWKDCLLRW